MLQSLMISVLDAVRETLINEEIAIESMREGILNLSAYANKIKDRIEKRTQKTVRHGTIVVALARLSKKMGEIETLRPNVKISNLIIKSPLHEITFDKSEELLKKVAKLTDLASNEEGFFTISQGITEITLIVSEQLKTTLLKELYFFNIKSEYQDLVSVTVRFPEEYLKIPNVIYSLVSSLASRRINLIEIVSTYTELSFIIQKEDMANAIDVLNNN